MSLIMEQDGTEAQALGLFFKLLVQAIILFVSEMWVVIPRIGRSLGGFQHRASHWLTVK